MKKRSSASAARVKQRTRRPADKVTSAFAEVKARRIPAKDLVWMFRVSASSESQRQAAAATCVELLGDEVGKRCRVVLEQATLDRRKLQDFILRPPRATPALLRRLDRGLAECCRRMKVKYVFLGYGEEVYSHDSWTTLGELLQPTGSSAESVGDPECRTLRFDGLYCHKTGDESGGYLRFYPDGRCISVSVSGGTPSDVARWFRREGKGFAVGNCKVQGSRLSAELELAQQPHEPPIIFRLKGRLTRQGIKMRTWSSYSQTEFDGLYLFHKVDLK